MNEHLARALDHISPKHIAEAAAHKKSRRRIWLGAMAAVLAVVILIKIPSLPMIVGARAVSTASGSRAMKRPSYGNSRWDAWIAERNDRNELVDEALPELTPFFTETTGMYISGSGENRVWSPVNALISLAVLAEVAGGNSRQQILDALNIPDLDTLRAYVGSLWESVYRDDGNEICTLANSLWLNDSLDYSQETMDSVAYFHYASVYQTDLDSRQAAQALRAWLNNNTGGLLKNYTGSAAFPENAVLTLASTVYLKGRWGDEFDPARNTEGIFHSPSGEITAEFMNKKEYHTDYYWGDSYGAVSLGLKNGTSMWFFLPDEDKTIDDILSDGQYMALVTGQDRENQKYMKVNLSVPKFDISSGGDLTELFRGIGITDIFLPGSADFSAITSDTPVVVTAVNQAARVIIDEEGVKAATYIEIPGAGAAMPPDEVIDFVLDRPFLFVIAGSNGIPLFIGAVNEPQDV